MKKHLFTLITFLFIISCNLPEKKSTTLLKYPNGYAINGTLVEGNSKKIFLLDNFYKKIDSAKIIKNEFLLQGKINSANTYYLQLEESDKEYPIVLENSDYEVLLNGVNSMMIGGKLNTFFNRYKAQKTLYAKQKSDILEAFYKQGLGMKLYFKKVDSIRKIEKKLFHSFLVNNKDNVLASILIKKSTLTSKEIAQLKTDLKTNNNQKLIRSLDSLYNHLKVIEEKDRLLRRKPVPLFSGVNLRGSTTSLEKIMKGKKAFLIDFWASWCAPCREISPRIKELYYQYKKQGFEILSVSEDRNVSEWKNAVFADELEDWYHIYDDYNRISSLFGVTSMPHMVLLDDKGRIIKNKITSIEDLKEQLSKIFNQSKTE